VSDASHHGCEGGGDAQDLNSGIEKWWPWVGPVSVGGGRQCSWVVIASSALDLKPVLWLLGNDKRRHLADLRPTLRLS